MRHEIKELLENDETSQGDIQAYFDKKSGAERLEIIQHIPLRLMGRLYDLCNGAAPVTAESLVPNEAEAETTVVFAGENSIPLLSSFEKRLTRSNEKIVGYNHQGLSLVSGPGYFTAKDTADGQVLFDYTDVPERAPAGWPAVKPNDRAGLLGASRLIYHNLHDFVRRVSTDGGVLIGTATRLGKPMNSYFILARK